MFKIQTSSNDKSVVFTVSGRIEMAALTDLQKLLKDKAGDHNVALDLKDVKLANRDMYPSGAVMSGSRTNKIGGNGNKYAGGERRISGQAKEESTAAPTKTLPQIAERLSDVGALVSRYGLVLVIFWIGAMKFTAYEANGIQPLVANSPFMGWLYGFLSVQTFSNLLGVVEIAIAVMIGLRWLSPRRQSLARRSHLWARRHGGRFE